MKKLIALALVAVLVGAAAWAEVWNDPGGVSVTDTSQTVTFPRPFRDVLVLNDDGTESVYVRLFWCTEQTAAATTNSLEVKAGKNRAFVYYDGENGTLSNPGYCAISLIGPVAGAAVRLEGK